MAYYLLRSDPTLYHKFLYVGITPDGINNGHWITGKKMSTKPTKVPTFVGSYAQVKLSDMLLTQFELPVFSPKAIEVLEKAGVDNLEYFPVVIKSKKKQKLDDSFKMVNIIGLVNCLDKSHADLDTFAGDPNKISRLRKYKIFEAKVPKKLKMFRLGEFAYHLLVDESVKDAWEKAGLTGAKFTKTEDYI